MNISEFDKRMGNCNVTIEIDRSQSNGTFTNFDVLSGIVKLHVTGSISLNYIQVKLEGVSKTELTIPREPNGKRERKDKVIQDVHKVLYDTVIVFPPENIRQVSNAKEFTLTPGTYTYPFTFKIPLNNSCIKLLGITNKVLFNMKKLDLKINNGNFNANTVKNMASLYLNGPPNQQPQQQAQAYHVATQLPPSLSGLGDFATVKYYVKVTCKRSSFLKVNLRAFDPFIFLPLDLDSHNQPLVMGGDHEEYKELFVRKDLVFRDRIPDIVGVKLPQSEKTLPPAPVIPPKRGFIQKFFDPAPPVHSGLPSQPSRKKLNGQVHTLNSRDVPFSFEMRSRHPAFLIPTKQPSFKLFLVSNVKPSVYSLGEYGKPEESNGLGVVYLQRLIVELTCTTITSVLENDGSIQDIHKSRHDDVINVCNNTYQNLKLDLFNCKKLKSSSSTTSSPNYTPLYELEIPRKYFSNCVLPDYLSPSFRTCNIQRKYKLTVVGGFSSEKIGDFNNQTELQKKLRYVDLNVNEIKVLSGLAMTSSLAATGSDINSLSSDLTAPKLPARRPSHSPDYKSSNSSADSLRLPTYDDVVRESSYQDDSEHQRARRRYQQHEQYYNNLE